MPENPRWKRRPVGSTWGDWGPDDQLGRLNLLTPDKVLKAIWCRGPAPPGDDRQGSPATSELTGVQSTRVNIRAAGPPR